MAITDLVATALGFGSLTQMIGTALEPKYGIYAKTIDDVNFNLLGVQEGEEIFIPSSWVKHEFIADSSMSNAPTEMGGYTSFNKVRRPAELRVVFALEGWMAFDSSIAKPFSPASLSRSAFIEKLDIMKNNAYTYNITTPDKTYTSYDMTHYDYQVSDKNGVTLLLVNAFFQEVMDVVESSISSSQGDSGTTTSNAGTSTPQSAELEALQKNTVQSADSWDTALLKVIRDPVSNIRSATSTVGSSFSSFSQTNVALHAKNVITGIATGLM